VPESIAHIGMYVVFGGDRLLTTVKYKGYDESNILNNNDEVNEWLMQRHANLPFHQACSSTSITSQVMQEFFQEHGIERATEVDDQQMEALHVLCANPHVTGDAIRAYLNLAPETANEHDSDGMTPFQYLCRSDFTFLGDRNFSSLMI